MAGATAKVKRTTIAIAKAAARYRLELRVLDKTVNIVVSLIG
jgi:hypothetical protein